MSYPWWRFRVTFGDAHSQQFTATGIGQTDALRTLLEQGDHNFETDPLVTACLEHGEVVQVEYLYCDTFGIDPDRDTIRQVEQSQPAYALADMSSALSSPANGSQRQRRFEMIWRGKLDAIGPNGAFDLGEMVHNLRSEADRLEQMRRDGVTLEPEFDDHGQTIASGLDDYYTLVTENPAVAEKYGLAEAEDG